MSVIMTSAKPQFNTSLGELTSIKHISMPLRGQCNLRRCQPQGGFLLSGGINDKKGA
jgi:hypothetical protein